MGRRRVRHTVKDWWSADGSFGEHRLRTALVALASAVLAAIALAVGPSAESRLGIAWAATWATVLSISFVTGIYDLFLRESYADAMRRFIGLNSTVVRTGLQALDEEADLPWERLFDVTTTVTFILVAPQRAVGYMNSLMRAARGRSVSVRFCFPDLPQSSPETHERYAESDAPPDEVDILAKAVGSDHRLANQVASVVEDLLSAFELAAPTIRPDSRFEVAVYPGVPFMEGVILDRATVLMLIDAAGRPRGKSPVSVVFDESSSPEVLQLRDSLLEISKASVSIEDKTAEQVVRDT